MRRWNGWGDENVEYPITQTAIEYLANKIGRGVIIPDAALEDVLRNVPEGKLADGRLIGSEQIIYDKYERLLHSRGQSLPDWIALRYGRIRHYPDGVAYPQNENAVRDILGLAYQTGIAIIPYGGGTSVVGHINPIDNKRPYLSINLSRLNKLYSFDEYGLQATIGSGATGPTIENHLNKLGYTLGHFPQSFQYSTLGGWIATRSSGQQSSRYGRIEDLFRGGNIETPIGPLEMPPFPASAAGPDLRHLVLGSEGRIGIITRAIVNVSPIPAFETFYGIIFKNWDSAVEAVREIAQSGLQISMLRLSDPLETETTFELSGKQNIIKWADRGFNILKYGSDRCLLIVGITTSTRRMHLHIQRNTMSIARKYNGLNTGTIIGKMWKTKRFLTPYMRNTLWNLGYSVDTLETALGWGKVSGTAHAIKYAITKSMHSLGERVLVFSHLSHVYKDGASIYITYIFRRTPDADETLHRWKVCKNSASQVIINQKGTISHQHGIGIDHAQYIKAEKQEIGIEVLKAAVETFDPKGLLNPGKLILNK